MVIKPSKRSYEEKSIRVEKPRILQTVEFLIYLVSSTLTLDCVHTARIKSQINCFRPSSTDEDQRQFLDHEVALALHPDRVIVALGKFHSGIYKCFTGRTGTNQKRCINIATFIEASMVLLR